MATYSLKHVAVQLGKRLQYFREKQGLSQEHLAEMAQISRTYIAYLETGTRTASLKTLYKIAQALQVSLKDLFTFS